MQQGGAKLGSIRDALAAAVAPGVTPLEIETLANQLIKKAGGQASFKMVHGYDYATCINVNSGVVHGIPNSTPFKEGDLVTIDVGLYFQGYHTDTSTSVVVGQPSGFQKNFLAIGQKALAAGISAATAGAHVSDISRAIQKVIESAGYSVIRELTGHGISRDLHEDPYVPNYYDSHSPDSRLELGQTIAIEPIYASGAPYLQTDPDGWTLSTADDSPAAVFEHTIYITDKQPIILTKN